MNRFPFYIGWSADVPPKALQRARAFLLLACCLFGVGGAWLALAQGEFSNAVFEYGQATELEGVLVTRPAPALKVAVGDAGSETYQRVLLVGYGKFGATGILQTVAEREGFDLDGRRVKVRGSLLYRDGKALLELSEGDAAFLEIGQPRSLSSSRELYGETSLSGEILDAKCYFGVMKPGEGKPHRSCAVRCLSGGIPPVMKARLADGRLEYVLLVGPNGEQITDRLLDFVAEPVSLCGRAERLDDWWVLYVDLNQGVRRLGLSYPADIPMCR